MEVRDAAEDDATTVATLTGLPENVTRELVHDRTTRIAVDEEEGPVGVVSFDARPGAVYVTQLAGSSDAVSRLLDEPVGFARGENMAVEVLIDDEDDTLRNLVLEAGFDETGSGPEFDGNPTSIFRLDL